MRDPRARPLAGLQAQPQLKANLGKVGILGMAHQVTLIEVHHRRPCPYRPSMALPEPLLWDLRAIARSHQNVESWVPNYHDLGRADLTAEELRKRQTLWSQYLLRQSTHPAC